MREFIEKRMRSGPTLSTLVTVIAAVILIYTIKVIAFIAGSGTYAELTIELTKAPACKVVFGEGEDVRGNGTCLVRGHYRLHPVSGGLVIDLKDRTVELPDGMKRVRAIRYLD